MNNSMATHVRQDLKQDVISLTTLTVGTLLNVAVIIYFLLLSPHKNVITNIILTLYSFFNSLICLQITPLAAAAFTSQPLVTTEHCPLLIPLYNISSNLSTFFLAVLAVDLGLSLVYKTERLLTKCKFVVMTIVYLCLLVALELTQLRFGVKVWYSVDRGICSWSSAGDNILINYIDIGSLIAVIIPVFLMTLSLVSLTCNLNSISTYNHTLLYASRAALLLSISYLTFHSVSFVVSLRGALLPLFKSANVENQVYECGRLMNVLLDGLYVTVAPILICLALPDVRQKFCFCRIGALPLNYSIRRYQLS